MIQPTTYTEVICWKYVSFSFNLSHAMLPVLLIVDLCIVKNAIYEICKNFCLSHMTLSITITKTNLNNADINELYLVQISGLWGSSQLLHNH